MAFQVGFWTDLSELQATQLSDSDEMVSTFMAMPYGEYDHPVYGKIKFDKETAASAAQHVQNRTRGTDLDIDYDHKAYSGEAAGWVQGAEVKENGLYLSVKWTKKAWDAIKSGAYRYFSPEFADEWKHPKTGDVHKNILFGGGITNRPFLKDILPLNMSELFAEQKKETGMDPKKLRQLLGLPEDATDEQVESALQERGSGEGEGEGGEGGNPTNEDNEDNDDGAPGAGEPQVIAASEGGIQEVIRLSENSNDPVVKALAGVVQGLHQTVVKQGAALHLSETAMLTKKLSEPVDGRALPAGAQKLLNEALLTPSTENIVKLMEAVNKTGYVQLNETEVHQGGGEVQDAVKKFNEQVDKLVKEDEMQYADAVDAVALAEPQLFEAYRAGSYAFREVN